MLNKKVTFITAIIIVGASIMVAGFLTGKKESMQRTGNQNGKSKAVTLIVQNKPVPNILSVSGTAVALNKIQIYAEVSGILELTSGQFRGGTHFAKGQTLVKIDDAVFRNNLMAQKSTLLNNLTLLLPDLAMDFPGEKTKWENYLKNFDMEKTIAPLPETMSEKERYYVAARNIYNQYYTIKSQEQTLEKYTIKAPYDGVVTESEINPGALVRVGQKLGEFSNLDNFEIAVSVSPEDLSQIKTGDKVTLSSSDLKSDFAGTIVRINPAIDKNTQTVTVYIISRDKSIKDGMYLTAHLQKHIEKTAFEMSKELLLNNNSVYVVKDSLLIPQRIEVLLTNNNKVYVSGLTDGQEILGKVYNNAAEGKKLSELELN